VASPIEALDARAAEGWTHVLDVPYEFDSNSRDTLIVLRHGYRREPPDWNAAWESHFGYKGMQVKIANANGGEAHKTDALEAVTVAALGGLVAPVGATATTQEAHHSTASGAGSGAGTTHVAATHDVLGSVPPSSTSTSGGHVSHLVASSGDGAAHHAAPRFDTVGADASDDHHGADGHHDGGESAAPAGHSHAAGGAGAGLGLLLALAGGAAFAAGATARRRLLAGRLAAAGLGAQLAGLGWDVVTHAQAGEGVHPLENGGHWAAMIGLAVTAAAAAMLLRSPVVVEE